MHSYGNRAWKLHWGFLNIPPQLTLSHGISPAFDQFIQICSSLNDSKRKEGNRQRIFTIEILPHIEVESLMASSQYPHYSDLLVPMCHPNQNKSFCKLVVFYSLCVRLSHPHSLSDRIANTLLTFLSILFRRLPLKTSWELDKLMFFSYWRVSYTSLHSASSDSVHTMTKKHWSESASISCWRATSEEQWPQSSWNNAINVYEQSNYKTKVMPPLKI